MRILDDILRVAIVSSQGRQIDLRFGGTDQLLIFDVRNDAIEFVESRDVPFWSRAAEESEEFDLVDLAVKAIRDCHVVVARDIGPCVQEQLDARGILLLEMACSLASGLVTVRGLLAA